MPLPASILLIAALGTHLASVLQRGGAIAVEDRDGLKEMISQINGSPVTSVAFSPDKRKIVSGSSEGSIKVWDSGAFWAKIPMFEPILTVSASHAATLELKTEKSQRPQRSHHLRAVLARWEQDCVGIVDKTIKVWDSGAFWAKIA